MQHVTLASFVNSSKTRREIQSVGAWWSLEGSNTFTIFIPQTCVRPMTWIQESPLPLGGRLVDDGAALSLLV